MIASAVETRKIGFFVFARRRSTEDSVCPRSRATAPVHRTATCSISERPEHRAKDRASERCCRAVRPCSRLRRGRRSHRDRTFSIVREDGAPTCREVRTSRSLNALNPCFSSSNWQWHGLSWSFPRNIHRRFENADLCKSRPDYNFATTLNSGQWIVIAGIRRERKRRYLGDRSNNQRPCETDR